MTSKTKAAGQPKAARKSSPAADPKTGKADAMIALMRKEGSASAAELAAAAGWQIHSVRGFIAGTLKKRADLEVTTLKAEGGVRYHVRDRGAQP